MSLSAEIRGLNELRAAIRKNPEQVRKSARNMFNSLKTDYQRVIMRNPWQRGGSGGGVPVDTGSLRDSHRYQVSETQLRINVPDQKADEYGWAVHSGRPWLDYSQEQTEGQREKAYNKFLEEVTGQLAK
jgi:hypothetical protein